MPPHRRSPGRPVSLVRREGGVTIRLVTPSGERMATHTRPCTIADALAAPFFLRRPSR
jgi:hypothetical protein